MIEHSLIRATVIPEIVKIICEHFQWTEDKALHEFYHSVTGQEYADDESGLYGQSPLYVANQFIIEKA